MESPLIGTSSSRYRVTARLGAGGMGEVYRAARPKPGAETVRMNQTA